MKTHVVLSPSTESEQVTVSMSTDEARLLLGQLKDYVWLTAPVPLKEDNKYAKLCIELERVLDLARRG